MYQLDIVWDGGRTARLQLLDLWPSVYMASNAKKKCKVIFKKNIWQEVILYCFRICFTVSENFPLFLSLNKVHARLYIKCFFYSHIISIFFYLSPNRTWNFVTNFARKTKVSSYKCWCWKNKIITFTIVQRINEFEMNEIQRKHHSKI